MKTQSAASWLGRAEGPSAGLPGRGPQKGQSGIPVMSLCCPFHHGQWWHSAGQGRDSPVLVPG